MTTKKAPAVKKTAGTTKKVSTKAKAKPTRVLARAEGPQCFWVTDGRILSDLIEFRDALEKMDAAIFTYHVKGKRNDFADWVQHVLGDTELAAAMRKTLKSGTMRQAVVRRLKIYGL